MTIRTQGRGRGARPAQDSGESHGEEVAFRERLAAINPDKNRAAGLIVPDEAEAWAWTHKTPRKKCRPLPNPEVTL